MSSRLPTDCTRLVSFAELIVLKNKAMRPLLFSPKKDNLANVPACRNRKGGDDSHGFLGSSEADLMGRGLDGNETR
jgi:hypothetical protein